MAVGFLTKGLPSFAFQILTLFPWLILQKKARLLVSWKHFAGIMLSLATLVLYFYLYHGELSSLDYLGRLMEEASQKTSGEVSLGAFLLSVLYFPIRLIKIMLPWSVAIFMIRWKPLKKIIQTNSLIKFSFYFILFNVWLYWFATGAKDRYLYMFIPFFLIILSSYTQHYIWIIRIAILLLVVRLIFNFTYLPILDRSDVATYREISNEIIVKTEGEDIYLFGVPQYIDSQIGIGDWNLYSNRVKTAPLFAYQISYYLTKEKDAIIPFTTDMEEEGYYIKPAELVNEATDSIVYSFHEKWQHIERVVVKKR